MRETDKVSSAARHLPLSPLHPCALSTLAPHFPTSAASPSFGECAEHPCIVLHLEDEPLDAELVRDALATEGLVCRFVQASDRSQFQAALNRGNFDLILADNRLPSFDGLAALEMAQSVRPEAPFLFLSGTLNESRAAESFRKGATDFVAKGDLSRLGPAVRRAIRTIQERTARRLAEDKLHEQAALLDEAQDAIMVRDLDHRIVFWNKSAERIFGWTTAEAVGASAIELLSRDDGAKWLEALQTVLETGQWRGEMTKATKAGAEVLIESRWTLLRDREGHPKSILDLCHDVTERKKLELQFLRAQRLESIGTLASGIAHDLNNILAPIMMSVNLLQESETGERNLRLLETLRTGTQRAADMVRQILSFTRGHEGARVELQLKHLVAEITKIIHETFPKMIQIKTAIAKDLAVVLADTTQIHQVLMNLCVNARDAMPEGGVLRVEARNTVLEPDSTELAEGAAAGDYVVLSVSDTGTGISPEIMSHIWEPFFTMKPEGMGTGLGLSTVLNIVKDHGGFIRTESEVGRGTTFHIYLPAARASTKPISAEPPAEPLCGKGERILVIDDERAFQEITKSIFIKYGYRCLTASDGTEGVALYAQHKDDIALVMTDMVMPFLDGPATINALRRLDPDVRIIAASGLSESERAASGLSDTTFLLKPFTTERLLSTVSQALKTQKELQP